MKPSRSILRSPKAGKGFLALAASTLFPGLGHLLAGRSGRGTLWLAAVLLLAMGMGIAGGLATSLTAGSMPVTFALLGVTMLVLLLMCVDAFICGRRSSSILLLSEPSARFVTGAVVLVIAATPFHPARLLARYASGNLVRGIPMTSPAMSPTLNAGDWFMMRWHQPVKRWDIVIYHPPENPDLAFIGRIAGVPGDRIRIEDGQLRVNGSVLPRPPGLGPITFPEHTARYNGDVEHPLELGAYDYFILGDNTGIAYDARFFFDTFPGHHPGAIPEDQILGRVTAVYWPPRAWRTFK